MKMLKSGDTFQINQSNSV